MADKKKKSAAEEAMDKSKMPDSPETPSMEEKLKAAAGNITKAHADSRERNSELVKRRLKAEKESKARLEEAEKRREANEKYAQQVADKKIAEFDYAQNYRKKLLKEREEAMSAAKQKRAEEREAAVREAKEAREQSVASYLEMERQEARERSERADALVNSVTKRGAVDEDENKVPVDKLPAEQENTSPEAEQAAEENASSPVAEEAGEQQESFATEEVSDTNETEENSDNDGVVPVPAAGGDDGSDESDGNGNQPDYADGAPDGEIPEEPAAEEKTDEQPEGESAEDEDVVIKYDVREPEDDDGKFEMVFDEDGNLVVKGGEPDEEEKSDSEESDDAHDEFRDRYNKAVERRLGERGKDNAVPKDEPSPEDLIIHDEIISAIKAEGARLERNEGPAIRAYIKHSGEAIKSFEVARREGLRALKNNRDDREAPGILAGIIKISGKILEVRCNNLEHFARLRAHRYIRDGRIALHRDIENYNEFVVTYSSLTGEQLTRVSTFLPENISKGKALAVIPELTYQESYVLIYPDEQQDRDEAASTTPITPDKTAEELFGRYKLPTKPMACAGYIRKAKRVIARMQRDCDAIGRMIYKTKVSKKLYENELERLEMRTPIEKRATSQYKNKVFRISMKYGKRLTSLKTVKAKSAFARERRRLFINRLAIEREKLVVAYMMLRAVYRAGKFSQRKNAESFFVDAMISYNKCVDLCSKLTGTRISKVPSAIIEQVCRADEEIAFPVIAYKRELVETVAGNSRIISTALKTDLVPDEEGYAESSGKIMGAGSVTNSATLSPDAMMVDRASAIAKVMLESLKEYADMVATASELDQYLKKSDRAIKYFKRALRASEKAISRAFDENGVVTALVENLRVVANLIEVRRINISVAIRLKRNDIARAESRALYKNIELYNGRAIDYMSIVGEQFTRISTNIPKELLKQADSIRIPTITYKDNYIEVFPKDPLLDTTYEKPVQRRGGVYTPLLMKHFRLTENRAVETTVINSPFVFDVNIDDTPVESWWHPIGFLQHFFIWAQPIVAWFRRIGANAEIWFIDESLVFSKEGLKSKHRRNRRRIDRYERKLKRLNDKHKAAVLKLETVVHETDRHTASYQRKIKRINTKFSRKIYRLKMRWMRDCTGRTEARILLEQLVLERERLIGINKVLVKFRNYGRITFTPNVLKRYKRMFLKAINDHNKTAARLSELIGVKFSEVSTAVADEIIRYGNMVKFPQIVCCREIIETIGGKPRTVGDKWHGYGLYTGTSGTEAGDKGAPLMSVGAMGYSTAMGVPYFRADFDGMTMLGMTAGGVPLIGFSKSGAADIPFTGTPMMLAGEDYSPVLDSGIEGHDGPMIGAVNATDPYSGINSAAVDAEFVDRLEDDAKDAMSGSSTETPLDLESKMIEERFSRSLRARSMTTVDGVKTWWKLVGSEINMALMRHFTLRDRGFLRILLPPKDRFVENVNSNVTPQMVVSLRKIAKMGTIVDIECKRLYSAVKVGIRRSQRIWSTWLHADIEKYNELVRNYNSLIPHRRSEWLEPLSLNIPDTIIHRLEDRPPVPPVLSMRNKVKLSDSNEAIKVGEIYNTLYKFATDGGLRHLEGLTRLITRGTIRRLKKAHKKGKRKKAMKLIERILRRRTRKTEAFRWDNEARHYRIRYEKGRAMKRYNRAVLRAIGTATDPIKYQKRTYKVLRRYVATNFRIDYNMRIRQLIFRALRIGNVFYARSSFVVIVCTVLALLAKLPAPYIQGVFLFAVFWILLPVELLVLQVIYEFFMLLYSLVMVLVRNIWLVKHGARDVEKNRYGAILECFVCEEYNLLLLCEKIRTNPKSDLLKRELIKTVNEYNKKTDKYSRVLRIPIKKIETTYILEKLTSGNSAELRELQNFIYARELVERVDEHKVGKSLTKREFSNLCEDIQSIIDELNLGTARDDENFEGLQNAVQIFVNYIQTGIKPSENQRFDLKRDMITALKKLNGTLLTEEQASRIKRGQEETPKSKYISLEQEEVFIRGVIKVVDQLGGMDKRRIISIVGTDNMIDTENTTN